MSLCESTEWSQDLNPCKLDSEVLPTIKHVEKELTSISIILIYLQKNDKIQLFTCRNIDT